MAELRAQIVRQAGGMMPREALFERVLAFDGSFFTVAANVAWAMQQQIHGGQKTARLKLLFCVALIGVLRLHLHTGTAVSKYSYSLLCLVAAGEGDLEAMLPILARRQRERDLARARLARQKAAAQNARCPAAPPLASTAGAAAAAPDLRPARPIRPTSPPR